MKNSNYEKALPFLEVQEDGSVYRKKRTWTTGKNTIRHQRRQLAKLQKTRDGYRQIGINIEGKLYIMYVHRLVAMVYIPKPEGWTEDWQVNHINGCKTDNRVENLEWVTPSENIRHAWRTGLVKPHSQKPVEQIDLSTGEVIAVFFSIADAARAVGGHDGHISKCCNGKRPSAYGFGWCYAS